MHQEMFFETAQKLEVSTSILVLSDKVNWNAG